MLDALNGFPGLVMLVVGLLAGWFARTGWWWLADAGRDTAERTRYGFAQLGLFLGRLLLLALVVGVGLLAIAALPHGN